MAVIHARIRRTYAAQDWPEPGDLLSGPDGEAYRLDAFHPNVWRDRRGEYVYGRVEEASWDEEEAVADCDDLAVDTSADEARAAYERGLARLEGTELPDGDVVYFAEETRSHYRVRRQDVIDLGEFLADPDLDGDAYSHWCAGTSDAVECDADGLPVDEAPESPYEAATPRVQAMLAEVATRVVDPGDGTLEVHVRAALEADPNMTVDAIVDGWIEAGEDARLERERS